MNVSENLLDAARRVVRELEGLGVEYRIIGGLAVQHHGYERFTRDIDLLVDPAGYARIRERLLETGFLPTAPGKKKVRDVHSGVGVDFLIAGVDRPGSSRAPITFPDPAGLPAETGDLPGKYVDLVTLIELKLFSAKYGKAREQDSIDVVQLLRRKPLPASALDGFHAAIRDILEYWWKAAQVREDPCAPDYGLGPEYANFDAVAALLRDGKISPREAVEMLEG